MTLPDPDSPDSPAWRRHLARIGAEHGFFDPVAADHDALFVQEGDTLVVSFDTATAVQARPGGMPIGFAGVKARQMSLLSIIASAPRWFRDPDLYAFFDGLRAEGFFDSFERVVFLGLGPACGHAACAYSAAAPGAHVIATRPAATLDPSLSGFDPRFRTARRLDFSTAYGDAATLVASAAKLWLIHDPFSPMDAAHAAQFRGANVERLPLRFRGDAVDEIVADTPFLVPFLRFIETGTCTRGAVLSLLRSARQRHGASLLHLALRAARAGQTKRAAVLGRASKQLDTAPKADPAPRTATAAE
jgi:hypothetical protein